MIFLQIIQFCHILVSTVFIIYNFGFAPVIFIYLELFIYLFLNKLGFVLFYWIFTVIFVYALDCIRNFIENDVFLPFIKFSLPQLHVLNLITTWSILKCISFNIDNADKKITVNHLLDYFAYILYFPNLFLGPFLPYKSFERGLKIAPDLKFRILALIQNLARCFFWFFLIHIFLHFVYINATIFHLEVCKNIFKLKLNCFETIYFVVYKIFGQLGIIRIWIYNGSIFSRKIRFFVRIKYIFC